MLSTTLRHMGTVSARTLLALGLAVGTVLALSPNANAQVITVNNPEVKTVTFVPGSAIPTSNATAYSAASLAGVLSTQYNSSTGYDVKVSSLNNGFLKSVADATKTAAYKMVLVANPANANVTPAAIVTPTTTVVPLASIAFDPTLIAMDVKITNDGANFQTLPSGDYKDTLTFSIVAK